AGDGRRQWQAGGQQGAEGDRQDDQRDDQPDQLRGSPDLALFFAGGAAELNLETTPLGGREGGLQPLSLARLDLVFFLDELDLGQRVASVSRDRAWRLQRVG